MHVQRSIEKREKEKPSLELMMAFYEYEVIMWREYEMDNEWSKIWHEIRRILVKQELKSLTIILEIIFKLLFQSRLKLKLFF
jgi:hypothetical protein